MYLPELFSHKGKQLILNFYEKALPEGFEMPRDRMLTLAFNRFKVLQYLRETPLPQLLADISKNRDFSDIVKLLKKNGICTWNVPENKNRDLALNQYFTDLLSHHMLKFFAVQEPQLMSEFIHGESILMQCRFHYVISSTTHKSMAISFLKELDIGISQLSDSQQILFEQYLPFHHSYQRPSKRQSIFIVPWEFVSSQVARHDVFCYKGWAFISSELLSTVIVSIFRENLTKRCQNLRNQLPILNSQDPRLLQILKTDFQSVQAFEDLGSSVNSLMNSKGVTIDVPKASDIPILSRKSFPLCAQHMCNTLTSRHKLYHQARLQFTLFLKGIELPMKDALLYFKKAFSDPDFDSKYAYNIRHTYGQEGARRNYPPWDCRRIITGISPASDQTHGCPYKHWNTKLLKSQLYKQKVSSKTIDAILSATENSHYDKACKLYFNHFHPGAENDSTLFSGQSVVIHPNIYFASSQLYLKNNANKQLESPQMRMAMEFKSPITLKSIQLPRNSPPSSLKPLVMTNPSLLSTPKAFRLPPIKLASSSPLKPPAAPSFTNKGTTSTDPTGESDVTNTTEEENHGDSLDMDLIEMDS